MSIYPFLCLVLWAAALLTAWALLRATRASSHAKSSPPELSALELSYLVGAHAHMTHTLLRHMAYRGWLVCDHERHATGSTEYYRCSDTAPPESLLTSIERELWIDLKHRGQTALPALLSSGGLSGTLKLFGDQLHRQLAQRGLAMSLELIERHDTMRRSCATLLTCTSFVLGLGLAASSWAAAILFWLAAALSITLLIRAMACPIATKLGAELVDTHLARYRPMARQLARWRNLRPKDKDYICVIQTIS